MQRGVDYCLTIAGKTRTLICVSEGGKRRADLDIVRCGNPGPRQHLARESHADLAVRHSPPPKVVAGVLALVRYRLIGLRS